MESLINLELFRRNNKITQIDLAKFLGTSRSFLSLVESGRSKLPDDKIDKILGEGRIANKWDVSSLNPVFCRLSDVCEAFAMNNSNALNWETGHSILHISPVDMLKIKHGKLEITDAIAEAVCTQFPDIDRNWLQYGNGSMMAKDNIYKVPEPSQRISYEEEIAFLKKKVMELEMKMDALLAAKQK